MPVIHTFLTFTTLPGLAVTSATIKIYGQAITDPVQMIGRMEGSIAICVSLLGLALSTLTTNIAANIVGPANALVNVSPRWVSFSTGAMVTALIGLVIMPWKLVRKVTISSGNPLE